MASADGQQGEPPPATAAEAASPEASRRLLLVEDDRPTSHALRAILSRRGWEVVLANTVSEGMTQLELKPECLILDLMLPDGDGASLLRKVRESDLPIRVVVTTGVADRRRLNEVKTLLPEAILIKPIRLATLLDRLDT